jgi:pimeloyl-ACP methyl ester carboxylesterase
LTHDGPANQFAGGFSPGNAPWGGFGGGGCSATRTPVVFIHGNGDEARNWDFPSATGVPSVYEEFRAAGYNDCELFGVNWLSPSERSNPQLNYHQPAKARLIRDFLSAVRAYTGRSQVDVISHSMGVTVALHGIDYGSQWGQVRRFVAIGGGLRGLASCWYVGYANPLVSSCGSQNLFDSQIFGFFPHTWTTWNPRMGNGGFRDRPAGKATRFYALHAGFHDQVLCTTSSFYSTCWQSAVFDNASNVISQLEVGHGATATQVDFDFSDLSPFNLAGGDLDGVGHFRSKNNTGRIQVNFLTTGCTGSACCSGYGAPCNP